MNSDTGEVAKFRNEAEALAAGFNVPLEEHEYNAILRAPKALNVRRVRKSKSRGKINWAKKYIAMVKAFNKTLGLVHSHKQERARRVRQMKKAS